MKYRPDIDGLRALAVVPVILFHANFQVFSGGYVGVDIFFVISGYLITTILYDELQAGRFSILRFYERRIRRIFPALFFMLAVTLAIAAAILMPDDFRAFGKYLVAATLFAANILFWRETDYFAAPAEMNPLLHTWSLAIEEQFYIFFPLLLALTYRFARRWLGTVFVAICILSIAIAEWGVRSEPTGAFYLLPARAWELLLGSLLAIGAVPILRQRWMTEAIAWAGLGAIVFAIFNYTPQTPFPGLAALLPCLGAAALIHTGRAATVPARLLSLKPIVGIGLASYSLYLWHWPLIVLTQYQLMRDVAGWERWTLVALSLLLSYLSWRYVERPFRSPAQVRARRLLPIAFASMAAAMAIGFALYRLDGLPQRVPELAEIEAAQPAEAPANPEVTCFVDTAKTFHDWSGEKCLLVKQGARHALLWGDSHASQYAAGLSANATQIPMSILLYASAGCAPVFEGRFPERPNCPAFNEHVAEVVKTYGIDTIILSAYWDKHIEFGHFTEADVAHTIDALHALVPNVIVIGSLPAHTYDNPIQLALRRVKAGDTAPNFALAPINGAALQHPLPIDVTQAFLIDPAAPLCADGKCLYMLGDKLLYRDNNHLSAFGSQYVVEKEIAPRLNAITKEMVAADTAATIQ